MDRAGGRSDHSEILVVDRALGWFYRRLSDEPVAGNLPSQARHDDGTPGRFASVAHGQSGQAPMDRAPHAGMSKDAVEAPQPAVAGNGSADKVGVHKDFHAGVPVARQPLSYTTNHQQEGPSGGTNRFSKRSTRRPTNFMDRAPPTSHHLSSTRLGIEAGQHPIERPELAQGGSGAGHLENLKRENYSIYPSIHARKLPCPGMVFQLIPVPARPVTQIPPPP
jgi:hypothetical protein